MQETLHHLWLPKYGSYWVIRYMRWCKPSSIHSSNPQQSPLLLPLRHLCWHYMRYIGGCQNYGPFLGLYYSTAPHIQGTQRKGHNFDNHPYALGVPISWVPNWRKIFSIHRSTPQGRLQCPKGLALRTVNHRSCAVSALNQPQQRSDLLKGLRGLYVSLGKGWHPKSSSENPKALLKSCLRVSGLVEEGSRKAFEPQPKLLK